MVRKSGVRKKSTQKRREVVQKKHDIPSKRQEARRKDKNSGG